MSAAGVITHKELSRGHKERAHALLSASGSAMWLACPPSARLNDELEETTSAYAEEGTLAHELAECRLARRLTICDSKRRAALDKAIAKITADERCDAEMLAAVDSYVETIEELYFEAKARSEDAQFLLEERVDYSKYAPEGFGSCDAIIIADGLMDVIDFKYGKGVPVSAAGNSQMRLYALGALDEYSFLYYIQEVRMTIIQPRLDSITSETLTVAELDAWGEEVVKPAAALAFAGAGDFNPGEKQCRWCGIKATCRARSEANLAALAYEFQDPPLLSDDEIGAVLTIAQQLKSWAADVEDYATEQLKLGKEIAGWKLVEGRSNRVFTDTEKVRTVLLDNGFEEGDILKDPELRPLGDLEKRVLGKKRFKELLDELVIKPPGKPKLAPETDPRAPINSVEADFASVEFDK